MVLFVQVGGALRPSNAENLHRQHGGLGAGTEGQALSIYSRIEVDAADDLDGDFSLLLITTPSLSLLFFFSKKEKNNRPNRPMRG